MRIKQTTAVWMCGLGLSLPLYAQTVASTSAIDRIREAASQGLGTLSERPWHLKLDATIFDDKGNNPQQGTIELWSSGGNRRTVFAIGDSKLTRLQRLR